MKTFSYGLLLFVFWILLSGHLQPLLLGLGLLSVVLTVYIVKRMKVIDHESYPLHLSAQLPAFISYLFREIVMSNIDVARRIFAAGPVKPRLIEVPLQHQSDLARAIYANSITLTPGTVSLALTEDKIIVHALSKEGAEALATGEMSAKIPDKVKHH